MDNLKDIIKIYKNYQYGGDPYDNNCNKELIGLFPKKIWEFSNQYKELLHLSQSQFNALTNAMDNKQIELKKNIALYSTSLDDCINLLIKDQDIKLPREGNITVNAIYERQSDKPQLHYITKVNFVERYLLLSNIYNGGYNRLKINFNNIMFNSRGILYHPIKETNITQIYKMTLSKAQAEELIAAIQQKKNELYDSFKLNQQYTLDDYINELKKDQELNMVPESYNYFGDRAARYMRKTSELMQLIITHPDDNPDDSNQKFNIKAINFMERSLVFSNWTERKIKINIDNIVVK